MWRMGRYQLLQQPRVARKARLVRYETKRGTQLVRKKRMPYNGIRYRTLVKSSKGDLVAEYRRRATSGNYENLLAVSEEYVNIMRI